MSKGKKIVKFISSLVTSILMVVLLVTLFMVVITKASGNEANLFGYQIKTVLSGSMEPSFKTGSIIAIETGGDMTRFQEGDVITFQTEEEIIVTHRVIEVNEEGQQYITKGDANDGADMNPVLSENILGEYTGFTIPYVGYVMNFANTREGAALLLIVPGVFFIGYSVITIGRTLRHVKKLVDKEEVKAD
ncbi:signal peptidase I [Virgibacillus sp. YIM 98842]|jgi:signal peptidase|uniref:signal peptidase I SipW n=1 Tax=Virgibacillus sp. YIM 98842 TaxID=2663533 RepID=UPI0013DC6613|nr:signal peptidase I [Virgibacillus sp. YIM 98842]